MGWPKPKVPPVYPVVTGRGGAILCDSAELCVVRKNTARLSHELATISGAPFLNGLSAERRFYALVLRKHTSRARLRFRFREGRTSWVSASQETPGMVPVVFGMDNCLSLQPLRLLERLWGPPPSTRRRVASFHTWGDECSKFLSCPGLACGRIGAAPIGL